MTVQEQIVEQWARLVESELWHDEHAAEHARARIDELLDALPRPRVGD